ncbi:MAG: hypothetical protein Q4F41_19435 [Eubacteriales bacterium]|nr:hypothetical protein [Eubacteriales bacterium]
MSGYHLCQVRKAVHPYYIESISTNIFTIEELCFYLQKNIYLIDETIMNERLCDWLRDELGLVRLYRKLYEQLERHESVGNFILPIFKEIGYLSHEEFKELQEQIAEIEVQPEDLRKKMKADYLVEYQMYANAIHEYYKILKNRGPGSMGVQFYASILNNMAGAYARLFLFEEAADCLWQSYGMVRSNEVYRKYLTALALYLNPEDYQEKLKELRVPEVQQKKIQETIRSLREEAHESEKANWFKEAGMQEALAEMKEIYHKSTRS